MPNNANDRVSKTTNHKSLGLALGLLFGAGLGTVLSVALDNPAFIGVGAGAGISIGLAIGSGLERRGADTDSEKPGHSH